MSASFKVTGMDVSGCNGILFAVDDLSAAVATVKAGGVPVEGEWETPVCSMAMIHDTGGNIVVLHKRKTLRCEIDRYARRV